MLRMAVAGTAKLAAARLRAKVSRIAASQLNIESSEIVFADGNVSSKKRDKSHIDSFVPKDFHCNEMAHFMNKNYSHEC